MKTSPFRHTVTGPRPSFMSGLVVALVAGLGSMVLAWAWLAINRPGERHGTEVLPFHLDSSQMRSALSPEAVEQRTLAVQAMGSRLPGQPGAARLREHVRETFAAAGLEVWEQEFDTAMPLTRQREIVRAGAPPGEVLPEVEIYPLLPNMVQPGVTPPEGLTGRLVRLDRETLRSTRDFTGLIGVVDGREGHYDPDFGFAWDRYAQIGLAAVIVAHPEGVEHLPWAMIQPGTRRGGMTANVPVNYVRLAASPGIFAHVGDEVTLRVRVDLQRTPATNLFGVLRAPHPAQEAVVVSVPADAYSVLPDLANNYLSSLRVATVLQLIEGLRPYQATQTRDIIFFFSGTGFMAHQGENELLKLLDLRRLSGQSVTDGRTARAVFVDARREAEAQQLAAVRAAQQFFAHPGFLLDPAATIEAWAAAPQAARDFLRDQYGYVVDTLMLEAQEPVLQARVAVERARDPAESAAALEAFLQQKRASDRFSALSATHPERVMNQRAEEVRALNLRERIEARLAALGDHHERMLTRHAQEAGVVTLFDRYRLFSAFEVSLAPGGAGGRERIGVRPVEDSTSPMPVSINDLFSRVASRLEAPLSVDVAPSARDLGRVVDSDIDPYPISTGSMWRRFGYQHFNLFSLDRRMSYQAFAVPGRTPEMGEIESLRGSLATTAEAFLLLGHGGGRFTAARDQSYLRRSYSGRVLVGGVGRSIVPSYPMADALVFSPSLREFASWSEIGRYRLLVTFTDPYGRYDLPNATADFPAGWSVHRSQRRYNPAAAAFGPDGLIHFIKDAGAEAQRVFKSVDIPENHTSTTNTTLVLFRAAPLSVLGLTNPRTLEDFTDLSLLDADGQSAFRRQFRVEDHGIVTFFLEPDRHALLMFRGGAPGEEAAQRTRAFAINPPAAVEGQAVRDIARGYLVADHPILARVPWALAESVVAVNEQRLGLQNAHRMADEQTNSFHVRATNLLADSREPDASWMEGAGLARDSGAYAMVNYPVLRESIFEAVIGILWYLGLLVPFVFFMEKLLFGFTDVRHQLMAQGILFLLVFGLLRVLHPAFEMIRSSLMILLGFVIILVSGGITLLLSDKFKENFDSLRQRRGQVRGAEVDRKGVMMAAFSLGLNNMNRRKLRTWLTCATLTLLTFVMISFTSVRQAMQESAVAAGPAAYQGFVVKRDQFFPIREPELQAFIAAYGADFTVVPRAAWVGGLGSRDQPRPANVEVSLAAERDPDRRAIFRTMLKLSPDEPLRGQVEFLTRAGWFTREEAAAPIVPVLLPDVMAEALGITPDEVDAGPVHVLIGGQRLRVHAIFSASSFNELKDLDGRSLMPFNIEEALTVTNTRDGVLVPDDSPLLEAEIAIVAPYRNFGLQPLEPGIERILSLAVVMNEATYRDASAVVENYLVRSGQTTFYGLGGTAYRGTIRRDRSFEGLLDLLIPLIIAGLTVLNTMRGSVYERRSEIYVYNAVGIAPRYIFFMFFAEALVYVVIGSMLGYLLSQGVGRALTELGLTGGLNMTFASLSTIYASLLIAVATLGSTWFPARSAMQMAAPADDAGWTLPEPDGDRLSFDLPFTFRPQGRLAVLEFIDRYLREHGEGSAGKFFTRAPVFGLQRDSAHHGEAAAGLVPTLSTTVWLKPFDLGVSQQLTIETPFDPETGKFKARVVVDRFSGTREAWMRLNPGFVRQVRQQFLHWRAVPQADRNAMFAEARLKLMAVAGLPPTAVEPTSVGTSAPLNT